VSAICFWQTQSLAMVVMQEIGDLLPKVSTGSCSAAQNALHRMGPLFGLLKVEHEAMSTPFANCAHC
jgi:hypothetical protein